jgi:lincosamide nucleotidyltransferase A/C/D/E
VPAHRPDIDALRWRLIGAGRAASAVLQGSPLARTSVAERLRARNPAMSALRALEVLDLLATAGVAGWVAGGWGIDALVGKETRPHYDLDFVIDSAEANYPKVAEVLSVASFRLRAEHFYPKDPMALRYEWRHVDDRTAVDILPVDFKRQPFSLAEGPFTTGNIGGRVVPCLSAQLQLELHAGYPPRFKDRKDIAALRSTRRESTIVDDASGLSAR